MPHRAFLVCIRLSDIDLDQSGIRCRPLREVGIAAAREPERRAEQRVGVDGDERRAVDRRGADPGAG